MRVFEILIAKSAISENGGAFFDDANLTYWIPDDARHILEPIFAPYNQDPMWFFDNLNLGNQPVPWAIVCFDREYSIAGHIVSNRPPDAGISFTPYSQVPFPKPKDFVPGVGVLVIASKYGIEQASRKSPLFMTAWSALKDSSREKRWLVILDSLNQDWVTQISHGDSEL